MPPWHGAALIYAGCMSGLTVYVLPALQALLKCPISSLDLQATASLLLASWQQSSSPTTDSSSGPNTSKQQALALEALALATDGLGAQLPNVLKQAGGSDLVVTQVLMQVQQVQRPLLAADGSIRHNAAVQAAVAAADAAAASGSSGFLIGTGLYDKASNSSSSSFSVVAEDQQQQQQQQSVVVLAAAVL